VAHQVQITKVQCQSLLQEEEIGEEQRIIPRLIRMNFKTISNGDPQRAQTTASTFRSDLSNMAARKILL